MVQQREMGQSHTLSANRVLPCVMTANAPGCLSGPFKMAEQHNTTL